MSVAAAHLAPPEPESGTVLGCRLDPLTLAETVARIDGAIAARRPCQHMAVNAAKLVKLQRDPMLSAAVAASEIVTADGQSVVWAARLLGHPLPERVTGIDLMSALLAHAERTGYGVYVLGARQAALDAALAAMRTEFPQLRIVGSHHGYFGAEEEPRVVELIRASAPELLFVALETPAKELFLARNRDGLDVPFVMGVGGAIDVLAGIRRRAPRSMQKLGLEWLFRVAQDPRRMARRYLVGNTVFTWLVLRALLTQGAADTRRSA